VSSGDILRNDNPTPEEVLEALREAITNNPRLDDMPVKEIGRQLVDEDLFGSVGDPHDIKKVADRLEEVGRNLL
jgi:hypothetical protein